MDNNNPSSSHQMPLNKVIKHIKGDLLSMPIITIISKCLLDQQDKVSNAYLSNKL